MTTKGTETKGLRVKAWSAKEIQEKITFIISKDFCEHLSRRK
jgi:hypothetical protein